MSEMDNKRETAQEEKNTDSVESVPESIRKKIVLLSIFSLLVSGLCLFLLSEKNFLERENSELKNAISELDYRIFEMQQRMRAGFDNKDAFFTEFVNRYKDNLSEIDKAFKHMSEAMDEMSLSIVNGMVTADKMASATGDNYITSKPKKRVKVIDARGKSTEQVLKEFYEAEKEIKSQLRKDKTEKVFVPAEKAIKKLVEQSTSD